MNNLIVNNNKCKILKIHLLVHFANTAMCFDTLQTILREFYIKQAYIKHR
jgi:hypothetical protein